MNGFHFSRNVVFQIKTGRCIMKTKAFISTLFILSLLALPFSASVHAFTKAPEFTADLVINGADKTLHAKLYNKSPYIRRLEMSAESGGMIFLKPDGARGKIWMLDPAKKQYRILSYPEKHIDPLEAWADIQYEMEGGFIAEETLDGHPCAVYQFKYPGKEEIALKIWQAEDLHFPIKKEADAKITVKKGGQPVVIKGTFRVVNIKPEKLEDSLFTIPADYTEIK
jgi:hypothetical protein